MVTFRKEYDRKIGKWNFDACLSGCYPHFEAATMIPITRIKFGVSWRSHTSCNAEQGAERVKRVEPAVESKREFIEVGL